MKTNLLVIAIGGAVGAVLRYLVSGLSHKLWGTFFPWGTLAVNLVGCFLIGFLTEIFAETVVSAGFRMAVLVGALGAFTTFSTFGLETANLLQDNEWRQAGLNMLLNNFAGVTLVFCGFFLARALLNIGK